MRNILGIKKGANNNFAPQTQTIINQKITIVKKQQII